MLRFMNVKIDPLPPALPINIKVLLFVFLFMHYLFMHSSRINNNLLYSLVGSLVGIGEATRLRGWYNMVCIYKGFGYQNRRNGWNGETSRTAINIYDRLIFLYLSSNAKFYVTVMIKKN